MTKLRKHILAALLVPALVGTAEAVPIIDDEPCVLKTIITRAKTRASNSKASAIIAWVTVRSGRLPEPDAPRCTEETLTIDLVPELDEFDPQATYSLLEFLEEPKRRRITWPWHWHGGGYPRVDQSTPKLVPEPSTFGLMALGLVATWFARRKRT